MQHSLDLESKFRASFGVPKLCGAPGRVNLVGEYTDCSEAYVMPAAIDFSCWAAAIPRDDSQYVIYPENFPSERRILGNFSKATFCAVPILVFDDIRLWNMLRIGKEIRFVNGYDLVWALVRHWAARVVRWSCIKHQIPGEK
jgi:hypothetical protein